MFIKQISIFIENVNDSLRKLTQLLGENDVNLLALSLADTSEFGIVRCIVRSGDTDRTHALLRDNGYIARVNDVVSIRIPHRPLGLSSALALLGENGVAVEYAYSFCRSTSDDAVIILRPSDNEKCARILAENGISMISQQDVDSF